MRDLIVAVLMFHGVMFVLCLVWTILKLSSMRFRRYFCVLYGICKGVFSRLVWGTTP